MFEKIKNCETRSRGVDKRNVYNASYCCHLCWYWGGREKQIQGEANPGRSKSREKQIQEMDWNEIINDKLHFFSSHHSIDRSTNLKIKTELLQTLTMEINIHRFMSISFPYFNEKESE